MKKEKLSQEEMEFFQQLDKEIKEEAELLVGKLQEEIDRGEVKDYNGDLATIVKEEYCKHVNVKASLDEGKIDWCNCLGSTCIEIGDGGRKEALIEKLKTEPFIKEREAKALTRLKRKYKWLKLANGVAKVLGYTLCTGLVVGGFAAASVGGFAVGQALATAAGWGAASWGAFSACFALGLGTAIGSPFVGMDVGNEVACALGNKEDDMNFDISRAESGHMMIATPREAGVVEQYPDYGMRQNSIEKGQAMFYDRYIDAKIYMAMVDICRERAKEASQEA